MYENDDDYNTNIKRRKKNEFEKEIEKSMREGNYFIFSCLFRK